MLNLQSSVRAQYPQGSPLSGLHSRLNLRPTLMLQGFYTDVIASGPRTTSLLIPIKLSKHTVKISVSCFEMAVSKHEMYISKYETEILARCGEKFMSLRGVVYAVARRSLCRCEEKFMPLRGGVLWHISGKFRWC